MMIRVTIVLCLGALAAQAEAPASFALRNARVIPVSGPVLERGTVLVRDGLIQAVGEQVSVPADTWVIEASGLTVYPGLIDALSPWGMPADALAPQPAPPRRPGSPPPPPQPAAPQAPPARGPEDRPSNTSWLRAADLLSPTDSRIESARSAGFTTAVSFPSRGIFAGQGAVIALAGERKGDMVVAAPAGLYLSLSTAGFTGFPRSLLGVIAYIRQIYLDSEHYQAAKAAYAGSPTGVKRPAYDRALEGVQESPRILLPATRAIEIQRMLDLAADLKAKAVIYGGHEAWRTAEALARRGVPILVSLKWPERVKDADPDEQDPLRVLELRDHAPQTPAALAKAGARFAFYSDSIENPRDAVKAVKRAIDAGLAPADAIRALTLSAAEIYGVADRLGSIEKGKIANLVVTDGDLFQEKTKVKYIFVDGVKFEPAPEIKPTGAEAEKTQ